MAGPALAVCAVCGITAAAGTSEQAAKPAKQLSIVLAGIHQTEDGALAPASFTHIPGETIYYSFQLEGYQVSENDKVLLSYQVDALDAHGTKLVETLTGKIDVTVSAEDKDWKPKVRQSFIIPPLADSGRYKIVASAKDELGGTSATKETSFEVQGHQVAPSDVLAIRNIRFLRSDEDREPLAIAAYRTGDALWAKFDIIGFKYGPGNTVNVDYGVAIVSPSGKTVFSQPQAAVEEGGSFYPKRYVPGAMNLTVQPKTPAGQYSLVITARDAIGNQTCEAKGTFRIE